MLKSVETFIEMSKVVYSNLPWSGKHEAEPDYDHKILWGKRGVRALKDIAKAADAKVHGAGHNKSGSIDRGYVTCFMERNGKFVYVSINDGMRDILYREAENAKDYTGGTNHMVPITEMGFIKVMGFVVSVKE